MTTGLLKTTDNMGTFNQLVISRNDFNSMQYLMNFCLIFAGSLDCSPRDAR